MSGPVAQDNLRKRTESGGGVPRDLTRDLTRVQVPDVRPLVQTITGEGSQDNVFSATGFSNVESQVCRVIIGN